MTTNRSKKYFSIGEVSKIIGIPQHKLRYLEKSSNKIEVFQIRGRRYYTSSDIDVIKTKFGIVNNPAECNTKLIEQIDSLIYKFTALRATLKC